MPLIEKCPTSSARARHATRAGTGTYGSTECCPGCVSVLLAGTTHVGHSATGSWTSSRSTTSGARVGRPGLRRGLPPKSCCQATRGPRWPQRPYEVGGAPFGGGASYAEVSGGGGRVTRIAFLPSADGPREEVETDRRAIGRNLADSALLSSRAPRSEEGTGGGRSVSRTILRVGGAPSLVSTMTVAGADAGRGSSAPSAPHAVAAAGDGYRGVTSVPPQRHSTRAAWPVPNLQIRLRRVKWRLGGRFSSRFC